MSFLSDIAAKLTPVEQETVAKIEAAFMVLEAEFKNLEGGASHVLTTDYEWAKSELERAKHWIGEHLKKL